MQRKIMTEKDKRDYEKRASGKISVFKRVSNLGKRKKIFGSVLIGLLIIAIVGGLYYLINKPIKLKDVIGSNYSRIEWSGKNVPNIGIEEIKTWTVKEVFPGSLGEIVPVECCFYDDEDALVGSITLVGHDNLLIYEGQIYQYTEPSKK